MPTPIQQHQRLLQSFIILSVAAFLVSLPCWKSRACGQTNLEKVDRLEPLNRFPRMTQEWMVDQVRIAEDRGKVRRAALRSKEDAEGYVQSARVRIQQAFGPLPEKTPLNARITKSIDRQGYRIECILFESRPGLIVSGNLYIPTKIERPIPGVIGVCGHSANGKAAEAYQSFAQGLARHGYACFIIDPIGQGERFQFLVEGNKSLFGAGVAEHIQLGNQQTLVGEFLGTWFAWDAIRGLDYLLSRSEIDPTKIGVTGNSGGGTQTTWLCGLESRWTMAAPACFVTTFRRNAENELPADTEQCPPRALALDLDHSDFLTCMAPKPTVILAQEKDFFDIRGSEESHSRLQNLYSLLGKSSATELHVGPNVHGFSKENREAMYRFFHRTTLASQVDSEPELTIEKDETLWCTPGGQVAPLGSRSVFAFTRDRAREMAMARTPLKGEPLQQAIKDMLKIPQSNSIADFRILRSAGNRKYPAKNYCTYAIETEPRIHALVTRLFDEPIVSRPTADTKQAILYVSHRSADDELRRSSLIRDLLQSEPKAAMYACDVRGIGESQPDCCGVNQFLKPYGSDYFHSAHNLMLDRPTLGQRAFDVLRVLAWLRSLGHEQIHLVGSGWGALPATFAGVVDDQVTQVTLQHPLNSFQEIAETESYKWPYSIMVPHVLERFDLPDCYEALRSKKLKLLEPWGPADGMNEIN